MTHLQDLEGVEQTLARPDVSLHYKVWGKPAEGVVPLVLLHGWAGSRDDWHVVEADLGQTGLVLSYDGAGFGRSQFSSDEAAQKADFSLGRYVEDLHSLLQTEGWERVRLVGHSWGGVVAMEYAARYPQEVESLVAIGAAYFDPERWLHQALKWISYLIGWLVILLKKPLQRSARFRRLSVRRYFRHRPDQATADQLVADVVASHPRAIIQSLLTGYEVQFKQICPKITCPTLYLGGKQDIVAPVAYVKAFVPLTPDAHFQLLEDCGHFPMLEQPSILLETLQQFWATTLADEERPHGNQEK